MSEQLSSRGEGDVRSKGGSAKKRRKDEGKDNDGVVMMSGALL